MPWWVWPSAALYAGCGASRSASWRTTPGAEKELGIDGAMSDDMSCHACPVLGARCAQEISNPADARRPEPVDSSPGLRTATLTRTAT